MKHKHYDMIVAKAANMDLVVFSNNFYSEASLDYSGWGEVEDFTKVMFTNRDLDIFLCLPKHKEACLHWLNGGESQADRGCTEFVTVNSASDYDSKWWPEGWFMQEGYNSRIKPKKEKRWIAVDPSTTQCTRHYSTKESCFNSEFSGCDGNASGWQFIEIEVEL